MRNSLIFFSLVLGIMVLMSQSLHASSDPYNRKDEQGRRQGAWRGYFESGALRYQGNFADNEPIGVFQYFYPQGGLRAELIHEPGEASVKATYYHRNRAIMGEGFFVNKQMEGLWRFFNENRVLIAEHYYQHGENHGIWKTFYPGGQIAETQTWHRGVMHGMFQTYYRDGSVYMKAYYENDLLNGKFEIFFPSGKHMLIGYYKDNHNDRVWTWYSEKGELEKKVIYDSGAVIKEEIYIETEDQAVPLRPGPTRNDVPWDANGGF